MAVQYFLAVHGRRLVEVSSYTGEGDEKRNLYRKFRLGFLLKLGSTGCTLRSLLGFTECVQRRNTLNILHVVLCMWE